jgi:hypothetical protein
MAGTLTVQNLQGPSSGANANKIIVPSGQELHAAGHVVSASRIDLDTEQTFTSASFIDVTNGSITVTPKTSNSTFIVTASCHGYTTTAGASWSSLVIRLVRDTADLGGYLSSDPYFDGIINPSLNEAMHQPLIKRTDTPSTTSAVTYKVQVFTKNGRTCIMNRFSHGFLEVIEIAG